jgi:hypothetical protein
MYTGSMGGTEEQRTILAGFHGGLSTGPKMPKGKQRSLGCDAGGPSVGRPGETPGAY